MRCVNTLITFPRESPNCEGQSPWNFVNLHRTFGPVWRIISLDPTYICLTLTLSIHRNGSNIGHFGPAGNEANRTDHIFVLLVRRSDEFGGHWRAVPYLCTPSQGSKLTLANSQNASWNSVLRVENIGTRRKLRVLYFSFNRMKSWSQRGFSKRQWKTESSASEHRIAVILLSAHLETFRADVRKQTSALKMSTIYL